MVVPKLFRHVSLYLHQSQQTMFGNTFDSALGKVVLAREQLVDSSLREEQWYALAPVQLKTDVHGLINLNVEWAHDLHSKQFYFSITNIKCQNISSFACDSFVKLKMKHGKDERCFVTSTVRRKVNPQFLDTFTFKVRQRLCFVPCCLQLSFLDQ